MSYDYQIDHDRGVCYVRLWGRVDGEQILDLLVSLLTDPRWRSEYDRYWDGLEVTEPVIDLERAIRIADIGREVVDLTTSGRTAVVAAGPEAEAILAFFESSLRWHPDQNRVFDDPEQAAAWLGVSPITRASL